MKSTSLFQLGGAAVLGAALLYGLGNLIYFLGGQPTAPTATVIWIKFIGDALLVLGLGALYARQARRVGVLGLVGYVLLVVATMFFVGNYAVTLGVVAGQPANDVIAQVPNNFLATTVMPWLRLAGLVVFGVATYRAGVFPKVAGALLVLLAIAQILSFVAAIFSPIFAVLATVAWGWLGWALLRGNGIQED